MRRLVSPAESERKKKRNNIIFGVVMLAVLVLGTAGYAFMTGSGGDENSQGNYPTDGDAQLIGNRWVVNVDGIDYYFTNSPSEVSDANIESFNLPVSYIGSTLYIDSESSIILSEISQVFGNYASRIQKACYGPCERDLPEKDCSENIIVWTDSLENKAYTEDKCVFIEGDLGTVEAYLYKVLGVR